MKMILDHPQVPGSGGNCVIAAQSGVQAIKLRMDDHLALNLGDQDQDGIGRCAVQFQGQAAGRLAGRIQGSPAQKTRLSRTNMRLFASECHASG